MAFPTGIYTYIYIYIYHKWT